MTPTVPQVDLFYSYRSPYSYLSIGRLAAWAEADGIDIRLRPVLPLAIRQPDFFAKVDPMLPPYVAKDAIRVAEFYGIPFKWPNPDPVVISFDPLSIPEDQPYIHWLTNLALDAARQGKAIPFTLKVSTLIWNGAVDDWTEGTLLADAIAEAGLNLAEMEESIAADPAFYADRLEENQAAHKTSGHWGVPCMVYEGEPFFGQDRIELLKWRVAADRSS